MSELFQIEPSLSPRLKWMREHEIVTLMEPGQDGRQWVAFVASNGHRNAYGATEDAALLELSRKLSIKNWMEV